MEGEEQAGLQFLRPVAAEGERGLVSKLWALQREAQHHQLECCVSLNERFVEVWEWTVRCSAIP